MAERYDHLDGLRGLAAVVVMVSHGIIAFDFALYTGDPSQSHTTWDVWLSGAPFQIPIAANLAVCLFFAMSGFVLMGAFEATRLGAVALLVKRYLRLAIPICAVCMLSAGMIRLGFATNQEVAGISRSPWLGSHFHQSGSFASAFTEGVTALWHNLGLSDSYDSSLWTMPIEFAGSVAILITCSVGKTLIRNQKGRKIFHVAVGALALTVFATSYLALFAAGVLIQQLMPNGSSTLKKMPVCAPFVIAAGLFFGTVPGSSAAWPLFRLLPAIAAAPDWLPWTIGAFIWHAVGAVLVLIGIISSTSAKRWLSTPIMRFLGAISFPLYLIHIPLLMTIGCGSFLVCRSFGLPSPLGSFFALAVFFAASIASATALARTVETFALRVSGRAAQSLDWARPPVRFVAQTAAKR